MQNNETYPIEYAGSESDGPKVDYKTKYAQQQQVIRDNFAHFDVPYNGADNNDYVDGKGFSEKDGSLEGAMLKAARAQAKSGNKSAGLKDNFQQGDGYEKYQFFYHPDHLGSSSFITDTEGEVVQHIEYVPYGEVFIEERNNVWNSPYLFNAKEFDEETGLYYYGARYYDPRLAMWYGVDPMAEKGLHVSPYSYCFSNPIVLSDPDGNWPWENRNVRNARRIASEVNGKFQRWEGQNGQTYASVTTTSYGEDGFTITANVCRPTAQNQHNAVWNMLESIDVKEGHHDSMIHHLETRQEVVSEIRAVAGYAENVSDGADALAITAAGSGYGTAAVPEIATVGAGFGFVADGLNIIADCVDGKYKNATTQAIGTTIGTFVAKKNSCTGNPIADAIIGIIIDKCTDKATDEAKE